MNRGERGGKKRRKRGGSAGIGRGKPGEDRPPIPRKVVAVAEKGLYQLLAVNPPTPPTPLCRGVLNIGPLILGPGLKLLSLRLALALSLGLCRVERGVLEGLVG